MKKSILASLLVPILLAGCSDSTSSSSSSSNGSSSSATYTWQIVHLESVDEDDLGASCVIYADSEIETDDSTVDDPEYQVITAYQADDDYNILYHYQDGTIAETIEASDINNGSVTITLSDVPDNGYVTLEELDGSSRIDYLGSFMFSVQKSLLDDMVLNITAERSASSSCVTGSDHREGDAITKFVSVEQKVNSVYYQTSFDVDSLAGSEFSSHIPVAYIEGESRDVLVTVFDDYTAVSDSSETTETTTETIAEDREDLIYWAFVDSSSVYDAIFDEDGDFDLDDDKKQYENDGIESTELNASLTGVSWTTSDTVSLDDDSGVIVNHNDTTYLWQPIYDENTELSIAYDTDEVDTWNSYFSGTVTLSDGDWTFTSFNDLTDDNVIDDDNLELFDFTTPIIASLDGTTVIDNTSSIGACTELSSEDDGLAEPSYCIDLSSNFDPDEFTYQRLHIRLEDTSGENFTNQTIISEANTEPVVLSSSEVDLGTSPTLTRIELNLMNTDDEDLDAVEYLMTQNIDLESVAEFGTNGSDDSAETDFYNDLNGYVATDAEIETLYQAVLKTNTTIVQSSYEP
ncbi:hypothetical protein [Psychromonas algicola]|uniref:hypothetical protein n=1 Tax=Psychromonas algicola TaxID=2555642 RepID=UPI0010672D48|nr:hypothetical protein [Psychromonas sp. RZ5]TEW51775.1 hypothetical protein E2R67_06035 [Psychromonas sp. RZ5]